MEEVLDYERLVYSIIKKYSKQFDIDDLYQVGMMGLCDAYKHYKSNLEVKFSTYAYYYILGEVNKYIRESSSLKISKKLINLKRKIVKAKDVMSQSLGREPTNLELSLFLEVDEDLIEQAFIATEEVQSIDDKIGIVDSYDEVDTKADVLDLRIEIEKLPDEERKLIFERYYNELTQSEASSVLGMSQVQVSRNEAKILQKLKTRL